MTSLRSHMVEDVLDIACLVPTGCQPLKDVHFQRHEKPIEFAHALRRFQATAWKCCVCQQAVVCQPYMGDSKKRHQIYSV
jgi:hypothetical protein